MDSAFLQILRFKMIYGSPIATLSRVFINFLAFVGGVFSIKFRLLPAPGAFLISLVTVSYSILPSLASDCCGKPSTKVTKHRAIF